MSSILVLSGSPGAVSRTAALGAQVGELLTARGHAVSAVQARELPPGPLLSADGRNPAIAAAVNAIRLADGVVVASPVYKAAYSGLLKALLDLLPQFAFNGKVILPIVTAGTRADALAIDYALRPVLTALGADHVIPGCFVLDTQITLVGGRAVLQPDASAPLARVVDVFSAAVHASRALVPAS